jgi:hypothetical protein
MLAILKLWTHRRMSNAFRAWCVHSQAHLHRTRLFERVEEARRELQEDKDDDDVDVDERRTYSKELKRYRKEEKASSIMKYCISIVEAVRRGEQKLPKPSRDAQTVLRGYLRRDQLGVDAVSAYCLDIIAALKRGDLQLPPPSDDAERALSRYLQQQKVGDNDDDSSSVTSFRSYVSSTTYNSYVSSKSYGTKTTRETEEHVHESRLRAFESVSSMDTRSLFGHSVMPYSSSGDDDDDDEKSAIRSTPRSTSSTFHNKMSTKTKLSSASLKQRREEDAIVKVQRWFRKNYQSIDHHSHHHHNSNKIDDREKAATRIQKHIRRRMSITEARKRKYSVVHIQRHFRGWRIRKAKGYWKAKKPWRP